MAILKKLQAARDSQSSHWVGDGFPVRNMFSYNDIAKYISPYLMMDYAGPHVFTPTQKRRGVGTHPHRGFETVTIVYEGQVEHRDSAGGGGVIQKGDVQWMTAASGLVHEEFHGKEFSASGGLFEMVQLWVNLPKKFKMTKPRYQGILSQQIPNISIANGQGNLRLISGEFQTQNGAAKTFSPIDLWDIQINAGTEVSLPMKIGHTAMLFILDGEVSLPDQSEHFSNAQLLIFDTEGDTLNFKVHKNSKLLFMGGEPLNEPMIGYGPFVMTTKEEIVQAFQDFENGLMGEMNSIEGSDR